MPAITTTHAAGTQLSPLLKDVLNKEQEKWNSNPDKMRQFFVELTYYIQTQNIFTPDNPINSFLDFLKEFMQSKSITIINNVDYDSDFLKAIDEFFKASKASILKQQSFTQEPIKITENYLQFIFSFFWGQNKDLLEKLTFTVNDLNEITIHIVKNRAPDTYIRNLVASFISIMKFSLDIEKFLLNYQQQDFFSKNVVKLSELIFSQQDSQALFTIPHFFSALAYEIDFVARSWQKLNISSTEIGMRQEKILITVTNLQNFFLNHLVDKHKCPSDGLKYLFFKYFRQEAQEIQASLSQRYAAILKYYSDEQFTPLPFTAECPTVPPNKFIIKHPGLTTEQLEVICQANQCAERNYGQWLKRAGFDFNQLPNGHLTYHVFNESRYDADLNYYEKFEPVSTAMYSFGKRNTTMVHGTIYAQYKSNKENQWQTAAHECTHHLNARLGYMPRSPDEGLGYRIPLGFCIDASFQRSVNNKYKTVNLTKSFFSSGFIGYDPSTLLASYFVDTNPSGFIEILRSSRDYTGSTSQNITKKIEQLVSQDMGFAFWKRQMLEKCRHHVFHKLGEGNGYCPPLLDNTAINFASENLNIKSSPIKVARTTTHLPKNTPSLLKSRSWAHLTPDEKSYELVFTISRNEFLEFSELLNNGANPNFRHDGNTLLHYLYFYGRCDTQYLKLLLEHGAKVSVNDKGLLPYALAEQHCDTDQLLSIKAIFDKNLESSKNNETALAPYQQRSIIISIAIPISALVNGALAGVWEELAHRYNQQYRYLPNIIFYVMQPATSALTTATMNSFVLGTAKSFGLDDLWLSFILYFGINFLSLIPMQLGEKAIQKIQNKFLQWLIPFALQFLLFNFSLNISLLTEGFSAMNFETVMMPLLSVLSSGLFFMFSKFVSQKLIKQCFPINNATESGTNNRSYFIRYSLNGKPKKASVDQQMLEDIKEKFDKLVARMKNNINKQAYRLNFHKKIGLITENISNILSEINEDEGYLNSQAYKAHYNDIDKNLNEIQRDLNELGCQSLWEEVTEILTIFRGIRPLKCTMLEKMHGGLETIDEEQCSIPLMDFLDESKSTIYNRQQQSFVITRNGFFPPPPTQEELEAMIDESQMPCVSHAG